MNRAHRLQQMENARQAMINAPGNDRLQRELLHSITHHAHFAGVAPFDWLMAQAQPTPEPDQKAMVISTHFRCPDCPDDHPGFASQNALNAHKRSHRKGGAHG